MLTERRQLTLDVGGDQLPAQASFKVGGSIAVDAELMRGDEVVVSITNEDGEIVAAGHGYVQSVTFKEHRPEDAPPWTERIHGIKVE